MINSIKRGTPSTLEKKLETYKSRLDYDGYSPEELKNNTTGYISKKSLQFVINGKTTPKTPNEDIYFYFDKNENSLDVPVGYNVGYVPLMSDAYGFQGETTQINPIEIENLKLNEKSQIRYKELLSKKEAPLSEILETVGYVVNSSMKYDFDKIIKKEESLGHVSDWTDAIAKYSPTGEEVSLGVCFDAGAQIRGILSNLGMESKYKISHVISSKNGFLHDTTLVFNKESGDWGVVNSKSPTKDFNFATKEQLEKLGSPYYEE